MIKHGHPQDFNAQRGSKAQNRMMPSAEYEAEVSTRRDQLLKGPASQRKMSRRHYKQTQRQAYPEALRQPNHQPQRQEATSLPELTEEEESKDDQQVPWHMGHLDGMTIPAFSLS